jgi:hypothetical protein
MMKAIKLAFPCSFIEEFKFCRQKRTRAVHGYTIPMRRIVIQLHKEVKHRYQIACN